MDYSILVGPIVGAIVGYCTNFIAVKMLFWPLKEIRVFGVRLPFTPGVIPKEKDRIIDKVARMIGEDLLSSDYIAKEVLNDNVRQKFVKAAIEYKNKVINADDTLEDFIDSYVVPEKFQNTSEKAKKMLCQHIYDSIVAKDPSDMIIKKVVEAVKEKLKGGLLSVMISDSFIASMADGFKVKIDDYIENELYDFIYEKINEQVVLVLSKKPSDVSVTKMIDDAMVEKFVLKTFDEIVVPEVSKMITSVDVPTIVTNKMSKMDVKELEDVLMSVLKKELSYIINFGLIIGFVIGLIGSLPIL